MHAILNNQNLDLFIVHKNTATSSKFASNLILISHAQLRVSFLRRMYEMRARSSGPALALRLRN